MKVLRFLGLKASGFRSFKFSWNQVFEVLKY
jgi:hypothetical protein